MLAQDANQEAKPSHWVQAHTKAYHNQNGDFTSYYNEDKKIVNLFQTGPKERITDQTLYRDGVFAEKMLLGTPNEEEKLSPSLSMTTSLEGLATNCSRLQTG